MDGFEKWWNKLYNTGADIFVTNPWKMSAKAAWQESAKHRPFSDNDKHYMLGYVKGEKDGARQERKRILEQFMGWTRGSDD